METIAGVIGSGSFGITVASLLAINTKVLLYTRQPKTADDINVHHTCNGIKLSNRIEATSNIEHLTKTCKVLFPVVPSKTFRDMMRSFSRYLKPFHTLIHGTKGFDLYNHDWEQDRISLKKVFTMSEVIQQESSVVKIGCLAGPNLAKEILAGQPTATVVASQFEEVIQAGQNLLSSDKFFVFGSYDLKGSELAGALKNIVALGSGILSGMKLGKNMQAMVITRGLSEMIYFGKAMGAKTRSFLGTAGIGDLVATATSEDSRNFTFGKRIGQGETFDTIKNDMSEVAEGVRTLKIVYHLSKVYKISTPITMMLYNVIYENYDVEKALKYLMNYPYKTDVDFLDNHEEGI